MPFLASVEGTFSFGKSVIVSSDNPITAGNATTTMSIVGATAIPGVAGVDDGFGYIPTSASFPWFFFGSNYGSAAANSIYWNTNNVLGFGTGINTITWAANTGRGILLGNTDRRTDPNAYYFPETTSGSFRILKTSYFFRNVYNAGVGGEGQMEIRLVRNTVSGLQYIEVRVFKGSPSVNSGAITISGGWNLTNGTAFQNTFGTTFNTTFPAGNTSFTISSDANGNTWTFRNNTYLNV
jgi:hypothetical protein